MITVEKLIEQLKGFPPETRVVVSGYEAGVDDIAAPRLVRIRLGVGGGVYGCHDEIEDAAPDSEPAVFIRAHEDHE